MTDLLQIEHLDYQRNYHRILTDINFCLLYTSDAADD